MGYINFLVEHGEHNALVVANEEDILSPDPKQKSSEQEHKAVAYARIKEKLIGRTFEIEPDVTAAIASFRAEISYAVAERVLEDHDDMVREVFLASEYRNLRHLRQSFQEFGRLVRGLQTRFHGNKPLMRHLLRIFLICAFEIRGGGIRADQIPSIRNSFYSQLELSGLSKGQSPKKSESIYTRLADKYGHTEVFELLLPGPLWQSMFESGHNDYEEITQALDNSSYGVKKEQPAWVRLLSWMELSDQEATALLSSVRADFDARTFDSPGVVLHVVSALLLFSKIGVLDLSADQIIEQGKAYMDHLKKSGVLLQPSDVKQRSGHVSHAGLVIQTQDFPGVSEVVQYFDQKSNEALIDSLPSAAKKLLPLMTMDTTLFTRRLILNGQEDALYARLPILHFIDAETFCAQFAELHTTQKWSVQATIEGRYNYQDLLAALAPEASWLESLPDFLEKERATRSKTISAHVIGIFIKTVKAAAKKLREAQPKN